MTHLAIFPILIPLFAAAIALFFEHRRFGMAPQRTVAWLSMAAMLVCAVLLAVDAGDGSIRVYLLGDWPSRLGIVLMADRLSALMLLVSSIVLLSLTFVASPSRPASSLEQASDVDTSTSTAATLFHEARARMAVRCAKWSSTAVSMPLA